MTLEVLQRSTHHVGKSVNMVSFTCAIYKFGL